MDNQFDCLMSAHQTLLQRYAELADRVDKQDLIIQDLVKKNTELHEYVYENEAFMSEFVSSYNSKMNEIFYMNENVSNTMLDAVDHKIKKELGPIDEQINEFVKNHEDTVGSLATKFSRFDKTFTKTLKETNEKIDKQDLIILDLFESTKNNYCNYVLVGFKICDDPVFCKKNIKTINELKFKKTSSNEGIYTFLLESLFDLNIETFDLIYFNNVKIDYIDKTIKNQDETIINSKECVKIIKKVCDKLGIKLVYNGGESIINHYGGSSILIEDFVNS